MYFQCTRVLIYVFVQRSKSYKKKIKKIKSIKIGNKVKLVKTVEELAKQLNIIDIFKVKD